jgi:hypothetical protein
MSEWDDWVRWVSQCCQWVSEWVSEWVCEWVSEWVSVWVSEWVKLVSKMNSGWSTWGTCLNKVGEWGEWMEWVSERGEGVSEWGELMRWEVINRSDRWGGWVSEVNEMNEWQSEWMRCVRWVSQAVSEESLAKWGNIPSSQVCTKVMQSLPYPPLHKKERSWVKNCHKLSPSNLSFGSLWIILLLIS